jgi:hypothetical protein
MTDQHLSLSFFCRAGFQTYPIAPSILKQSASQLEYGGRIYVGIHPSPKIFLKAISSLTTSSLRCAWSSVLRFAWLHVWLATWCPSSTIRCITVSHPYCGSSISPFPRFTPVTKNVAFTEYFARRSRISPV